MNTKTNGKANHTQLSFDDYAFRSQPAPALTDAGAMAIASAIRDLAAAVSPYRSQVAVAPQAWQQAPTQAVSTPENDRPSGVSREPKAWQRALASKAAGIPPELLLAVVRTSGLVANTVKRYLYAALRGQLPGSNYGKAGQRRVLTAAKRAGYEIRDGQWVKVTGAVGSPPQANVSRQPTARQPVTVGRLVAILDDKGEATINELYAHASQAGFTSSKNSLRTTCLKAYRCGLVDRTERVVDQYSLPISVYKSKKTQPA